MKADGRRRRMKTEMKMNTRMRPSVGWVPGQVAEPCRVAPLKTLQLDESLADVCTWSPPISPPRILASVMRRLRAEDGGLGPRANK